LILLTLSLICGSPYITPEGIKAHPVKAQIFQIVLLNLFGTDSLDELLNPQRRKPEDPYNLSLLRITA
jgi:hypothetical protein